MVIQAPINAGSTFFNYKGTHSIVLLAVCDAHYHFILVDVGDAGCQSDGGVLANSEFGYVLENRTLDIPNDRPLPGTTEPNLPFVIVGDEAFPLNYIFHCSILTRLATCFHPFSFALVSL